jgi:hypothetical protein
MAGAFAPTRTGADLCRFMQPLLPEDSPRAGGRNAVRVSCSRLMKGRQEPGQRQAVAGTIRNPVTPRACGARTANITGLRTAIRPNDRVRYRRTPRPNDCAHEGFQHDRTCYSRAFHQHADVSLSKTRPAWFSLAVLRPLPPPPLSFGSCVGRSAACQHSQQCPSKVRRGTDPSTMPGQCLSELAPVTIFSSGLVSD